MLWKYGFDSSLGLEPSAYDSVLDCKPEEEIQVGAATSLPFSAILQCRLLTIARCVGGFSSRSTAVKH